MKFDRKQHYSLRKYKSVGLASAVVSLSMLGATGVLNDVPVVGDLLGVKEVHAGSFGETFNVDVDFGIVEYDGRTHADGNYVGVTSVSGTYGTNGYWQFTVTPPSGYIVIGSSSFSGYGTPPSYLKVQLKPTSELHISNQPTEPKFKADPLLEVNRSYRSDDGIYTFVGTKSTVTRTPIDFTTRYVKDPARVKGAENITETEGRAGEIVRTVRYTLNTETGVVSDLPAEETKTEPTNKVVKVAAKDKVETFQRGRQTVERTHK